jgi:hypothetical protein
MKSEQEQIMFFTGTVVFSNFERLIFSKQKPAVSQNI